MAQQEHLGVVQETSRAGRTRIWLVPCIVGVVSLVGVGLASSVRIAQAQGDFTNGSMQGTWGFAATGTLLLSGEPAAIPLVALGLLHFDGTGICSIAATANINGASAPHASTTCTYTVDPNGIGSLSAVFPETPEPATVAFVIVHNETELRFISTDVGVVSGVARKQ
ncbi:MAG TPA: hypothetical protein VIH59_32925 [Candidatus Tectomicrobia bacterium]